MTTREEIQRHFKIYNELDDEMNAIRIIFVLLCELDIPTRERVLRYLESRFEIKGK